MDHVDSHDHHHARRWAILGVIGLAQLMVVLDATIVNIAMPTIQNYLHFTNAQRQWIVTAYSLAFGSLLLLGGRLSDLIGRKNTLLVGLFGFAAASALGGASTSFLMLVIARAIQGAFGAILAPAALAMLTITFTDRNERAKAFSIYGAIAGSGAAIGLLLGGILTQYTSWRWTLFVNLFFAAIAIIGTIVLMVHDKAQHQRHLDAGNTALVSLGLLGIVYALSHAADHATNVAASHGIPTLASSFFNTTTLLSFLAGVLFLVLFFWRERRSENPMLPLSVIMDRTRGGAYLAIFLSAIGMFAVFLFLTYYLQGVLHFSPVGSGVAFLPMPVALSATAIVVSTKLLPKYGPRPLMSLGMLFAAIGMVSFTRLSAAGHYDTHVLPGLLVTAVGMGLIFAPGMNVATYRVERHHAGVASALVNVAQQIGGSIGTALLNTVAVSTTAALAVASGGLHPSALVKGYTTSFWWAAIIFFVGAAVSLALFPRGPLQFDESELVAGAL